MSDFPVLIVCDDEFAPTYANPGDAGADLRSRVDGVVPARGRATFPTGIAIALPDGYVALVHPRSGLAAKHGVTVMNAPGTVDAAYRGEVAVILYNSSDVEFEVKRGDRIAQVVFQKFETAKFVRVEELPDSHRGTGGFGSSGRS
jgi:dUTP pyrophosphatase